MSDVSKYNNRKTLKIEKDGFFFIKRKEKKVITFGKYKNWELIMRTINCNKKASFYYKKNKEKIKENILSDNIYFKCCIIKDNMR